MGGSDEMNQPRVPFTQVQLLSFPSKLDYPGWSLPPLKTCPNGPCNTYCYGRKGRFVFGQVKNALMKRYRWTQECAFKWETDYDDYRHHTNNWPSVMERAIKPYTHFRVHVVGDMYSVPYAEMWYEVCSRLLGTKFWIPTRMWNNKEIYTWLVALNGLPNVTVRPSADPGKMPHKIDGLSAGTTIENPEVFQCPANTNPSHGCKGCVICYEDREREVSYKLK